MKPKRCTTQQTKLEGHDQLRSFHVPPRDWQRKKKKKKKKKHRSKELAIVDKISEGMGHTGEFFRRRDGWRKHPLLTSNLRQATPGLGIALVAFGIYLVGEQVYNRVIAPSPSHSHHTHHQHSAVSSSH